MVVCDIRSPAPDAKTFLAKFAVKCGEYTHLSFKGGYDEFCRYKGKWSIPDDPKTQRELAVVIENLYKRAKDDEKHQFAYLIELKTPCSRFVQDLDIRVRGTTCSNNFDLKVFLCELAKILHECYPSIDLTCVLYDSSGFSRKRNEAKMSYHVAWNVIVDRERAANIHQATINAFEEAASHPGTILSCMQLALLDMHAKNSWTSVIDGTVHKKNGIRMPYCDKCEARGADPSKVIVERRPAVAVGEFRFGFGDDCVCEMVSAPSQRKIHDWIIKGMLRTSESLTEPFIPHHISNGTSNTISEPIRSESHNIVNTSIPNIEQDANPPNNNKHPYRGVIDVIKDHYPEIRIAKIDDTADGAQIRIRLHPIKDAASRKCTFAGRSHSSNNMYFVFLPNKHVVYVQCWDEECRGQSLSLPIHLPFLVDERLVHNRPN